MQVIASPRAVWVALTNGKSIVRIDPATNRVVATTTARVSPVRVPRRRRDRCWWAAACGGDVVARVDSRTHKLTASLDEPFPVGMRSRSAPSGSPAEGSGNIDQIDPHTGRLVARLHVAGLPVRLSAGFGSIWVNDDYGRVLRIKPQR